MKKTMILLIMGIIIVSGLIVYMLFFRNNIDYSTYESINDKYYIIDRTEECAEMLEEIYRDDEKIYQLTCLKSATIYVIDKETKEEFTLRYAFDNKLVTIDELITTSIEVYENNLLTTMVEILGTNINLREDHATDSNQVEDYSVTKGETYEVLDTYIGTMYTWYKIEYQNETGWFADNGSWAKIYTEETNY